MGFELNESIWHPAPPSANHLTSLSFHFLSRKSSRGYWDLFLRLLEDPVRICVLCLAQGLARDQWSVTTAAAAVSLRDATVA